MIRPRTVNRPILAAIVAVMLLPFVAMQVSTPESEESLPFKSADIGYEHFFNQGNKPDKKSHNKETIGSGKLENEVLKSKVEVLGETLKHRVQALRHIPGQKVELVFLVDSSASVGAENFFNELKFVRKLLADFTVSSDAARVSVVTFSSKNRVVRHIDHLSPPSSSDDPSRSDKHKCRLLEYELPAIGYTGGGTYTLGALLEAQAVLEEARPEAVKAVFLITDGYSNGGDPRPAAKRLREQGVQVFTFGIRNGNVQELYDMASEPAQEYSYIVDSFEEFEALARRALHEDLQTGSYLVQNNGSSCDRLCKEQKDCCHSAAQCTCGTHTGHYACLCPPGHYGTGLKNDCHPCPGGTYRNESGPGDLRSCRPCPDENHISPPGSTSVDQCTCDRGYVPSEEDGGRTCQLLACPKLDPPRNGYFVKQVCNSVFNGACGIRCNGGYKLMGSSIRLCQENGTWSGEETLCQMRNCGPVPALKNGRVECTSEDSGIDSECNFICDQGFSLVGSKKRVCLPIGQWDGLPAYCKPVFCNPLPKVLNGTLSPTKCLQAKMRYGEECNVTCSPGYDLRGPSMRRCTGQGTWTEEDAKTRCVDVTPPTIACPADVMIETEEDESFAHVSWDPPRAIDNSGIPPEVVSVPAVTEQPMRFRIGTSTVTYMAHDRRGNQAECSFQVTVMDNQPPRVDQCESPPTFLLRDRDTNVVWDDPVFSDNSGKAPIVERSHDPGPFPLGETEVIYTAEDESGNNSTCTLIIRVQEHACHLPTDPIHGQANCSKQPEAVYCSLTCHDGYAFAMPPPRNYFCAYDGQWLPSENPLPFPDCSVTTHSDALIQDGIMRLGGDEEKICHDPFLMSQMEGHLKRRLVARLNDICGDNMICQIDDLQAECRQIVADETDSEEENETGWDAESNDILRFKRSIGKISKAKMGRNKNRSITVELRFKVTSRFPDKDSSENETRVRNLTQQVLLEELSQLRAKLTQAALGGEFNVNTTGRLLNVFAVQFNGDGQPKYSCPVGSVPMTGKEEAWARCVYCPVGTFFNVVSEICESCTQGSYQPEEGQLSCLVCPQNTSTKVVNAKRSDDCQAQCLAGSYSPTGLEPCSTCPQGTYQTEYSMKYCQTCPEGSTTWRRGARRVEDCKPVCPAGQVSETGLSPCFHCPAGFYQPLSGQKFCIRCPKRAPFTLSSSTANRIDCLRTLTELNETLPEPEATEEFEEASLLEVNECFSLPCLNGGQCQALEFGYICNCLPGFTGMQCQTDVDECDSGPCLNGATCVDGIDSYQCICPPGFSGSQCQTDVDECLSGPCHTGATCLDRTLGYTCVCPPGMTGLHCELELDECLSNPCQNNGTCYDRMANYTCVCSPGWIGRLCEEAVDECLSQPCSNGATCEDLVGMFVCHCPVGYDGELCQNDVDECASQPCASGSTCQDRLGYFVCLCPPGVIGSTCDTVVDPNYSLDFSSAGKLDYAAWDDGLRASGSIDQLTLCAWIRTLDQMNYGTVFSYATDIEPNALTLTDYSGFVLYVNGVRKVTDVTAYDGLWHLICVTWNSSPDGEWQIYADGELKGKGVGLAVNTTIHTKGTVILGQEQDSRGGGFNNAESFVGHLYGVELWDSVLDEELLVELTVSCNVNDSMRGNLLTWADFKHGLRGGVRVEESPFCHGCSQPPSPKFGNVSVIGNEAIYSCKAGYALTTSSPSRPCLIHGGWSGPEPECQRIRCGFPGYIPNGIVNGSVFFYGDFVTYSCTRGYYLSGEASRTCQDNGEWSGQPPDCVPLTCDPIQPPINGTLISSPKEVYAVGDKVSFHCLAGFRLDGPSALTCQEEGQWEDVVPVCQPLACTQPPHVEHGIVTNGVAEILPEDLPSFLVPGSILTFTCQYGYELESSAEVQCSHDGYWFGRIPKCSPIRCGSPPHVPNAAVHLSPPDDDRVGTVAFYVCEAGYEHFGPTQLECTEIATWLDSNKKPSVPVCMLIDCGPIPTVDNGEVHAEEQTFGSQALITCYSGYKLVGPIHWTECQADGEWTVPPQCEPIACHDPPASINNGTVTSGPFAAGEAAAYSCDKGFQLSDSSMTCTEDGSWIGTVPQCLPMECTTSPAQIEYGWWTYSSSSDGGELTDRTVFYTGAQVTYSCQEGYEVVGDKVRECLGSVGWLPLQPLPICRQKPPQVACPALDNPDQGTVFVEGFEPGQTARFECNFGFKSNGGIAHLVCNADGKWESAESEDADELFRCEEIICNEPEAPTKGSVTFTSLNFGSKALFHCDQGFVLNGSHVETCGNEGKWIGGSKATCLARQCPLPEGIDHGYIVYEGILRTGSSIRYECAEGYKVVGAQERLCLESGDWTEEEPSCQTVSCERLPDRLNNGTVVGADENGYGSVVQFACDPGYELLGPERVTCESNEHWSGPFPSCWPVQCPNPGLVAQATVSLKKSSPSLDPKTYHFGDELSYICRKGYNFKTGSAVKRRCLADGTWSAKPPICQLVTCPDMAIPPNGFTSRLLHGEALGEEEKSSGAAIQGQVVKFGCKSGYQLSDGIAAAICLETGKWNVTASPSCRPVRCPQPTQIKNGKLLLDSNGRKDFSFSDQVHYVCDSGFRMKGDSTISCTASGLWSSAPPTCSRAVCPVKDSHEQFLKNGHITPIFPPDNLKSNHPIALKFYCKAGYDLVGNSVAQCTSSGEWSHPVPACVPWPCDSPPVPLHGQIKSIEIHLDVIVALVRCDPGFRLTGSNLTCGPSGKWKGELECQQQTCSPPQGVNEEKENVQSIVPFKSSYKYGEKIHFQCREGHILNTQNTSMTCAENDRWDGRIPSCVPIQCPVLEAPLYGSIKGAPSTSIGSRVTISCDEGYRLEGVDKVTCLPDGRWSNQVPSCVALYCRDPPHVDNGWMVVRGIQVGDVVSYSCRTGFHLTGDRERTCLASGQWSGIDPVCDPVVCPVPEAPEHGSWIVGGFVPGSSIRFECETGYALVGSASITCLMDKSWSDRPPRCQRVTCPQLKEPEHGTIQITHWTSNDIIERTDGFNQRQAIGYRSVVHYKCEIGYQLFGPERRTCTAQGTWSERGPHCQRIWCNEPQAPDQGFVMGTGRQFGDRVRYVCSPGYRLMGANESVCQASGNWSFPRPACQALTCNASPPVIQNAIAATIIGEGTTGSQIILRCQEGYVQVGDLTVQCLSNRQWSTVNGYCQKIQCTRPTVKGASSVFLVTESGTVPDSGPFQTGDRILVSCRSGRRSRINSAAVLLCQSDGHWLGQLPNCEITQTQNCDCLNGGSCSPNSNRCICPLGYSGDRCQQVNSLSHTESSIFQN